MTEDFPIRIGDTTVYGKRLPYTASRSSRRAIEIQGTSELAAEIFGPDIKIRHTASGRPFIEGYAGDISVSHGAGMVLLAVNPHSNVGIDIEQSRALLSRVASRFLSKEELQAHSDSRSLLLAWTAKEAVFKAADRTGIFLSDIRYPANGDMQRATITTPDGGTATFAVEHRETAAGAMIAAAVKITC